MSVHSTHYDNEEEYERDLAFEYRREQYELDHGIPFFMEGIEDEEEGADE